MNTGIQETEYTLPYLTLHTELFIKDENEHFDSGNVKSYIKMNKGSFKIQKCIFYYLKGQKRKIERGYRLKANHFSSRSRPMKVLSDVPISRN